MMRIIAYTLAALLAFLAGLSAWAGPGTGHATAFTYQGRLVQSGKPYGGAADMTFQLFDASIAGSPVTFPLPVNGVIVIDGRFTVQLDFGASAFDNSERWLEIEVNGVTLTPRQPITRTPYAIQTRGIFVDDGLNVGIGTNAPVYKLHVQTAPGPGDPPSAAIGGLNAAPNGDAIGVYGLTVSPGGFSVRGLALAQTGAAYGGHFQSASPEGVGVFGRASSSSGFNYGVYGRTDSSQGVGVFGMTTGGAASSFGGKFEATGSSGTGVVGVGPVGVRGSTSSTSGLALYGVASASGGETYGVFSQVLSPEGYGVFSVGTIGSRNFFQRNVGIGSGAINPSFLLELSENSAAKPTSNTWTIASDARLKKNIHTITHALDDLLGLRGVTYQWIDPASQGGMDGVYAGFIAQEVEPVFPEWITEDADGSKHLTVIGFEGLVVEALRELHGRGLEKDAEIARLRGRLDRLESLVESLMGKETLP